MTGRISGWKGGVVDQGRGPAGQLPPSSRGGVTRGRAIPDGSVVEGSVLRSEKGGYLVRIAGQAMQARSDLPLFPGQHFRAVWDSKGDIPLLRLSGQDMEMLSRFQGSKRSVAAALLSRGLPLSEDVLSRLSTAMKILKGTPQQLGALTELFARGVALNSDNVNSVAWYLDLSPGRVLSIWKRIQHSLRQRLHGNGDALSSLRELMEEKGDLSRFLKAHSLLARPALEEMGSAVLAPLWWPCSEESPLVARVSASARSTDSGSFSRVAFEMEGKNVGPVSGVAESDGSSLALGISVEREEIMRHLQGDLPQLEKMLDDIPLKLQHIGVKMVQSADRRTYRRLDVEA